MPLSTDQIWSVKIDKPHPKNRDLPCILYSFEYNKTMYSIETTQVFDDWLSGLKDARTRFRLLRRLDKAQRGLLGDFAPVGQGVYEMREFFGAWLAHVLLSARQCVDRDVGW